MGGTAVVNQPGVYGTQGMPGAGNVPGARVWSVSWTDASGNFWLFGGTGFDGAGGFGELNDLWRFDGTNWTWISGSSSTYQAGVYGTRGVPDPANVPSARHAGVSWADASGNLWMFAGQGWDGASTIKRQ